MASKTNKLSERIIELRKQKAYSQQELADRIKISRAQMNRYENQAVQPPADVLKKLADVLGTSVDYLVSGATGEKAQATLKDAKMLEQYKLLAELPEGEKNIILRVVDALIREYNTRNSYSHK